VHFPVWWCADRGDATVSRLSVRPSVRLFFRPCVWDVQTQWNNSTTISRRNSLSNFFRLTPKWAIWCSGKPHKFRVKYGWVQEHIKSAISPKRCKIGPRLLWRTNRKSHTRFHLVTLDDLKGPKSHCCRKERLRIDRRQMQNYYMRKNIDQWWYFLQIWSICGYSRGFLREWDVKYNKCTLWRWSLQTYSKCIFIRGIRRLLLLTSCHVANEDRHIDCVQIQNPINATNSCL